MSQLPRQPVPCSAVTRGPEARGSEHQGLKLRGSDSLGQHKRKNLLPAPEGGDAVLCSVN